MISIIIPVLDSHEIVRRQLIHWKNLNLPEEVEIILVDDGSDPPIKDEIGVKNLRIIATHDTRPWTWALARNRGAREAQGDYYLMVDIDYILPKEAIYAALAFRGDKMRFKREFGVLDENGNFTQDWEILKQYGLPEERLREKGTKMPPHPNNFVMKKEVYWAIGGYREDLCENPYPQREDGIFKREFVKGIEEGKWSDFDFRPTIYMFPNGKFCGDVDYNPFNLFHALTRKTKANPFITRKVLRSPEYILSVIIPARNEEWLERTIDSVLLNAEMYTQIITILDGYWPDPPIADRENVTFIHHTKPVGQRAAVNEGARLSNAKYIMKLDAHCIVDKGFDRKLIEPYENGEIGMNTTSIPRMYNLHAFDWVCDACGERTYQGPSLEKCAKCGGTSHHRDIVWNIRGRKYMTESWMFDKDMHFQYWHEYRKRPEFQSGDIVDVMSSIGACFFMPRQFFFDIDCMDENHGSWGQFGTEIACKSWLSGGRHVVNKRTWFSHLFRTRKDFSFPYKISGDDQEMARIYSRDLWLNNKWHKQVRPLQWIIDKFAPVPTWENTTARTLNRRGQ